MAGWTVIDAAFQHAIAAGAGPEDRRWLLVQTAATAAGRRSLLAALPFPAGGRILDIGCGFGASSLELAALRPCSVTGIDIDEPVLEVASSVAADVIAGGGLPEGSTVDFAPGDVYALTAGDGSVDAVISRFVFQHLSRPDDGAAEIARVLRPGGLVCLVDVDDGLSISEPPPSPAFERLAGALRAAQTAYGGDRHIGRRLAGLLDRHGMAPTAVLVLPQAAYSRPQPGGPERALLIERLEAARPGIVDGGHMTDEEFGADLATLQSEDLGPTCEIEAHVAVLAVKQP